MKKTQIFQFLKILFFLGIGAFSIWWFLGLLSPQEKKEILQSFGRAKYGWLIASMFVGLISHYVRALRWNMLIKPLGYTPNVKDTFAAVSVGYIGNFILPRFGEVARCYLLKKTSGVPVSGLFGTVIVERIVDMMVFFIMFFVAIYVFLKQLKTVGTGYFSHFINSFTKEKIFILIAIAAFGILILLLMYIYRPTLKNKPILGKIYNLINVFKNGLLSLFKIKNWPLFVFYTIIIWVCYVVVSWLCFFALTETANLSIMAAFASVTFGTIGIILVQGGIGVFPAIVSQILVIFGITYSIGYAMGWLTWLSQTLILLAMGLWAFMYIAIRKGIKLHEIGKDKE